MSESALDSNAPVLEMVAIGKTFPGVRALDDVSLRISAGEFHSLVGENGAGKSTLIKVLSGVYRHGSYQGQIRMNGSEQRFSGVRDAEDAGIAVVHQELSFVPELTAAENIILGHEPRRIGIVDWEQLYASAHAAMAKLNVEIDLNLPVRLLGIGQRQLLAIARSLVHQARLLILDEPTAALTDAEAELLFQVLKSLQQQGVAIIYISHRLTEVFRLSDRITVLRDGRVIKTAPVTALTPEQAVALMVGRDLKSVFPPRARNIGGVRLEVRGATVRDPRTGADLVRDVSFALRDGEILGIAGLVGAGRTELLMSLFGASPGHFTGDIFVEGKQVQIGSPSDAISHGIALVTEDRRRYGLVVSDTIVRNTTLSSLQRFSRASITDQLAEWQETDRIMKQLRTRAASPAVTAETLSGGNQQKVVLGKWLLTRPKILLLDEPTRGIDVGAREEFYRLIAGLAEQGLAILVVSSEMEEVLGLSDRLLVMYRGRITGEFGTAKVSQEEIMACAIGQSVRPGAAK